MTAPVPDSIRMIPINRIDIVNPRVRNRKVFLELVESIATVGLKRPITVASRQTPTGPRYDLVCGQGRLEAFQELGRAEIPAAVIEAAGEDCLVMSLVENIARRQHQALDLLRDLGGMSQRGHSEADIARKTGLSIDYVRGCLRLLKGGETRLLRAVESGHVPVSVAVDIADAEDTDVQLVLQEAYEKNLLRGQSLLAARRLVEQRRKRGRKVRQNSTSPRRTLSVTTLVRTYRQDVEKKRMIVRDATATRGRLIFVIEAMRRLMSEEGFVSLLRAEGLGTMPVTLAERVRDAVGSK